MRLYDEMVEKEMEMGLLGAMVIDVQDVYDSQRLRLNEKEELRIGEDPNECLFPPFPHLWIEWKCVDGAVMGVNLYATEYEGYKAYEFTAFSKDIDGQFNRAPCNILVLMDNNGARVWNDHETGRGYEIRLRPRVPNMNQIAQAYQMPQGVVVEALDLCNMTNVKLIQKQQPHSRQEKRQAARHGIEPPIRCSYRVLELDGRSQTLFQKDAGVLTGNRALHWVRGHRAIYMEHPLFGRYRGRFWVPAHKRGNPEAGISQHSYKVTR